MRTIPPGLYVTMYCGMQEPKYYISKLQVRQGLLRRIIIIYVPKNFKYLPPIMIGREQVWVELRELFEDFIPKIKKIEKCLDETGQEFIDVRFLPDVWDEINEFDKALAAKVDSNPTDTNLYKQSFSGHLTELAMCKAIANYKLLRDNKTREYYILITQEHLEEAKRFLDTATGNCDEYIQELGSKTETVRTKENVLEMVFGHINRSMPNGIKKSALFNKTKLLVKELDEVILTLQAQHRIEIIVEETKGRPRRIFKVRGWQNV